MSLTSAFMTNIYVTAPSHDASSLKGTLGQSEEPYTICFIYQNCDFSSKALAEMCWEGEKHSEKQRRGGKRKRDP